MSRFLLIALLLLVPVLAGAQCMLIETPLQERIQWSAMVVEGRVVQSNSFWGPGNALIYTAHRVEVFKVFKGSTTPQYLEVITEGGIVGLRKHVAEPSLGLHPGDIGVFILAQSPVNYPASLLSAGQQFAAVYGPQGFVKYDLLTQSATDPFSIYPGISTQFYQTLQEATGMAPVDVSPFNPNNPTPGMAQTPTISSFSPDTITAGTFDTLTINGNSFGSSFSGSANVEFRNADNGGSGFISTPSSHIISWSNTQIMVLVPTRSGTGTFRVTATGGGSATSSSTLTVMYNLTNLTFSNLNYRIKIVNRNNQGGFTFRFNNNFNNNAPAVAAFNRALESWRCGTFVNLRAEGTTSISCEADDGVNIITFDNSCPLSGGTLATTYGYYSGCGTAPNIHWSLLGCDIKFRNNPSGGWNFGPGPTTGSNIDFQSVAVHELGHAHQLGHIIDFGKVMHYALAAGTDTRNLDQNTDIAGGDAVVDTSIVASPCGPGPMTMLNSTNCVITTPIAAFGADPVDGCVSLTVNFTDSSSNNPTAWQWDINNDGTIDYTTQHPTHTYHTPGLYSVKLIVSNNNGSDTLLKTNFIEVLVRPSADAGADKTICQGITTTLGGNPTASGGTGVYTYSWLPTAGLSNPSAANPISGPGNTTTYTLTVTDANGCTATDSVTVTVNLRPNASAGPSKGICEGESTLIGGSPTASGGTPPYTYAWSPTSGLNDPALANPTAAPNATTNYTVTVTDSNSCTRTAVTTVTIHPLPVADAGSNSDTCTGSPVIIGGSPTASGGTGPYIYEWSPSMGLSNASEANPLATPTNTTSYTVTVTDATGCVSTSSTTITLHPLPDADGGSDREICSGSAVIIGGSPTASGGIGPYTYTWSPATGLNSATIANPSASPAISTTYTVTVTDANGCTSSAQTSVTINALPQVSAGQNSGICPGGSVVIGGVPTATGGTFPYTYSWSPSTGLNNPTAANPIASPAATTTYQVIVTDAAGCTGSSSVIVTVYPVPSAHAGSPAPVCLGDSAILGGSPAATGGTSPYQYQWSPTTGLDLPLGSNPKAAPGTTTVYTLTVTDNKGCVASASATVVVNQLPVANAGTGVAYCLGGSATIGGTPTASGGTGPYTYLWGPGTGLGSTSIANPTASPLATTSYAVTVTDANGCTSSTSAIVTVHALPVADAGQDATFCPGANVTIGGNPSATGGTAPYTYSWSPATGLNSTSDANPIANPGSATSYILLVNDTNSCQSGDTILVTPSGSLNTQAGNNTAICTGTSATLGGFPTADGGIAPYTYSWSPATGLSSSTAPNPVATPSTTTTYTVQVSDSLGCSGSGSITVTVHPLPVASAGSGATICSGQSAQLQASGGTGYVWTPTTGLSNPNISNPVASPTNTSSYTVSVSDQNGCSALGSTTVTVHPNPIANAGIDAAICAGEKAAIGGSPSASGGTSPYSYTWTPATGLNGTALPNPDASPTSNTTYTLTVSDANSCQAMDSTSIEVRPKPVADAGVDTSVCAGEKARLGGDPTSIGGTAPYSYQWSPQAGSGSLTGSNPEVAPSATTTFTLVLSDFNSCKDTSMVTVSINALPLKPSITMQADSLVSDPADSYQWWLDGQMIAGEVNRALKPTTTGYFQVEVTNTDECSSISDSLFYEVTGIDMLYMPAFQLFPNPSSGIINLEWTTRGMDEHLSIHITDILGREVWTGELEPGNGARISADLSQLSPGLYLVLLRAGQYASVRELLIAR